LFLIKRLVRVKFPSVIIFINITININLLLLLLLQSPHGARASTAISQIRPNIKTLDSTGLHLSCVSCIIDHPVDVALVKYTLSIKVHFSVFKFCMGESPFSLRNSLQFRRRNSVPVNWYEGH
jgi:hypothetical protein